MRMIIAAMGLTTAAAAAPEPNICERMASQIGMKQVLITKRTGDVVEWRTDTASFGQKMFGGTVATSFKFLPFDGVALTPDEDSRLRAMCDSTKKGAECALVGPAALQMGTRRGVVQIKAQPGERATVGVRGSTVYCRIPPAA